MLSNEMTCTHFTLYSNTMRHMYVSNFKRAKSQYNASYLSTSKLKVSFVFHFYSPAVYFGDINLFEAVLVDALCVGASLFGKDHTVLR